MPTAFYITHPQVHIDPDVPVPRWCLSDIGRARANAMLARPWIAGITRVVSSDEVKAVETATILADHLGLVVEIADHMGENDRSATGFLPAPQFEAMADLFFAHPHSSVRGWERAIDAQARIVGAVERALASPPEGDIAFVGHGAVGTLLMCHLLETAIARAHDQPGGGGHVFAFDIGTRRMLHTWRAIDAV